MTFWQGAAEGRQGGAAAALSVDSVQGGPMHHELMSAVAQALALLLHPSLHTYPHTLPQRRCAFRAHRRNLQLLLVFRAQVGYEATAPIVVVDNAIPMLKIRRAAASFAVLDVPSVCV